MNLCLLVVFGGICLVWGLESETSDGTLDSMNCLHKEVKQFAESGKKHRSVVYDPTQSLTSLLRLYLQIDKTGLQHWVGYPGKIITDNFLSALLYGKKMPWNNMTRALLRDMGETRKIPLDFLAVLSDSSDETGVCLKENLLTAFSMCSDALTKTSERLGFGLPNNISAESENKLLILLMADNQLSWRQVSGIQEEDKTFQFISLIDDQGQLALDIKEVLSAQISQMLVKLNPFLAYVKNINRCNYFLWHALSWAVHDSPSGKLSPEQRTSLSTICQKYLVSLTPDTRKRRSLVSFNFRDNSLAFSELVKNVKMNVKNDEVLQQNDINLKKQAEALAKNVESLKKATVFNMDSIKNLLISLETRSALFRMNQDLTDNKFTVLGNLRDASNLIVNIRTDFERMMDRLMSQLTAVRLCHAVRGQNKISCAYQSGYLKNVDEGRIIASSPSEAFKMSSLQILSCLYLDDNVHPKKTLFVGNRHAFSSSVSYLHNQNFSCPRDCFESLKQDLWECGKCLTSDDKNTLPPFYVEPFHYVINDDVVYLQSISGPVKMTNTQEKERTVGLTPVIIEREEFPIAVGEKLYPFSSFLKSEEFTIEGNFFLEINRPGYFKFESPKVGTQGLVKTKFKDIPSEIRGLFKSSFVFRVSAITGLIVTTILSVGCTVMIYCRCRRQGARKVMDDLYQKYIVRRQNTRSEAQAGGITSEGELETLPRIVRPNPPLGPIGRMNRNTPLAGVTKAMERNNTMGPLYRRDPRHVDHIERIPLNQDSAPENDA